MCRRIIGSLIGLAAVVGLSVPAYAEKNPIFAKAAVTINTEKENKAVSGKGYYADYYGYYGNYYSSYASYYGYYGYNYKNYVDYYYASQYASAAASSYYYAYYYQYNGQ